MILPIEQKDSCIFGVIFKALLLLLRIPQLPRCRQNETDGRCRPFLTADYRLLHLGSSLHKSFFKLLFDSHNKFFGCKCSCLAAFPETYKVLGHFTAFDCVNTCFFKLCGKVDKLLVAVKLATLCEGTCPCKNCCNGVGGGLFALKVTVIVACNGVVSCLLFIVAVG